MGQHKKYFISFVTFELLNLVVIFVNFHINNIFLNGKFFTYGFDVVKYYSLTRIQQKNEIDPTCNVFPTIVSNNIIATVFLVQAEKFLLIT